MLESRELSHAYGTGKLVDMQRRRQVKVTHFFMQLCSASHIERSSDSQQHELIEVDQQRVPGMEQMMANGTAQEQPHVHNVEFEKALIQVGSPIA